MSEIIITRDDIINILQNGSINIELPEINIGSNSELPFYFAKNNIRWKLDLSSVSGFEQSLGVFYYNPTTEIWVEEIRINK